MLDISVDPFSHLRVEEFDLTLMAVEDAYNGDTVVRTLGRTVRILCASPGYLLRAGTLDRPGELHAGPLGARVWLLPAGAQAAHGEVLNALLTVRADVL